MSDPVYAIDTNILIAWLENSTVLTRLPDTLGQDIMYGRLMLPPLVISEFCAGRNVTPEMVAITQKLRCLPILTGYWERAGLMRGRLLAAGRRARLGDSLIAQSCIDADIPLLTLDTDFAIYTEAEGLKLV
jgi:predicted nucleic acid-binding protein